MLFSIANTAAALASLASLAAALDTNFLSCTNGPFAAAKFAGSGWADTPEYQHFCEAGWVDGDVLTGIRVWKADWQIKAVQMKWGTHDFGPIHGDQVAQDADLDQEWDPSSKVVIKTWHNKPDDGDPIDAVGKISVEIDGKEAVETHTNKYTSDDIIIDTAAEMILGVAGASGAWVSTIMFVYLESSIVSTSLASMEFTDSVDKYNEEQKGLSDAALGSAYFYNDNEAGGLNVTYGVQTTVTKTKSRTISSSQTHSFGAKIGFSISATVKVPEILEITATTSTEYSYGYENMKGESSTDTDAWAFGWNMASPPGGIPPQTAIHCTATATMGTFDSAYNAKVAALLDNGKTFEYNDAGKVNSVGFTDGVSHCKTIPLADVPKGQTNLVNGKTDENKETIDPPPPAKRSVAFKA